MKVLKRFAMRADNVGPITGRAGAALALEPQEAYPPARSTALAGYAPVTIPEANASRIPATNTSRRECDPRSIVAALPAPACGVNQFQRAGAGAMRGSRDN